MASRLRRGPSLKTDENGWYVNLVDMGGLGDKPEPFEYAMPWQPDVGEQVRAEEWPRTDGVYWEVESIDSSPDPEPDVLHLVLTLEA
jgi:hypothetical protein